MNLNERAILVSLKIGLPTGTRRDKKATEDVERLHSARNLGRFNKDLINKDYLAPIKSIETQARAYLYQMTVPWGDDDSRLLAVKRHMDFSSKMSGYGALFDAEAQTLMDKWDDVVAEAKRRLGALYDAGQYPTNGALKSKFKFRVGYTPVPVAGDLRVSLDADQLDEIKARIEEDSGQALRAVHSEAWERLYEKVEHMADRLADPKSRVFESLVDNLRDLCDILPDLNFTDDPRLDKAVGLVKAHLLVPVAQLRDVPVVKENTAVAARKIATAMAGWMAKKP